MFNLPFIGMLFDSKLKGVHWLCCLLVTEVAVNVQRQFSD